MNWLYVFMGGGIGSLARWFIFRQMHRNFPAVPPYISTFAVNAIGCLLIGFLFAMALTKSSADQFKLFWLVGFLGGLTTFSTLGLDIFQLIQERSLIFACAYFMVHGLICILCVYAGNWMYTLR